MANDKDDAKEVKKNVDIFYFESNVEAYKNYKRGNFFENQPVVLRSLRML